MRLQVFALAVCVLCCGCMHIVRGPSDSEFASADFGSAPKDPAPAVHAFLNARLRHPDDSKVEIAPAEKDYWGRIGNAFVDRELHYGWCSLVKVDAANIFGGYLGWESYRFCFRGDSLAHVDEPTRTDPLEQLCRQCVPQTVTPQ